MTASNTGGWVRRVGAAGGGKTYRRRRPVNFYGVLGLVVVLGLFSVGFARYDYRKPAPTLPTPFAVAIGISVCGTQVPSLEPNPQQAASGYQMLASGVLEVAPTTFAQAAKPNLLSSFVATYRGLHVTPDKLVVPIGLKARRSTHTTDERCPKGTKDHGKVGHVEIATWKSQLLGPPVLVTTDASKVTLTSGLIVTIGFVPKGATPPRPPESVVKAMETEGSLLVEEASTTTTTTIATSTSSVATTSTTTPPSTTTTAKKSHKG